eukprot:599547-Rhodomonas_salina.1
MPKSYWPEDDGAWTVECIDTKNVSCNVYLTCSMVDGPVADDKGAVIDIPMSQFNSNCRNNIRLALTENYAHATTPQLVFEAQAHYVHVYGARAEPAREVPAKPERHSWKPTTINNSRLGASALFALHALTWSVLRAAVGESSSPLCG